MLRTAGRFCLRMGPDGPKTKKFPDKVPARRELAEAP
jgi:hypothetical protein